MFGKAIVRVCVIVVAVVSPAVCNGVTVPVGSRNTGGFGEPNNDFEDMVLGPSFSAAGEQLQIMASGLISLYEDTWTSGPSGINYALYRSGDESCYWPLEEAAVEAGSLVIPRPLPDTILAGQLMAAFVPESTVVQSGFMPRDNDLVSVGIASTQLFPIGSGPYVFTAPGPGRLYLGVNDCYGADNNTAGYGFNVDITPVPEPCAIVLLGAGVVSLLAYAWRRRRQAA